MCLSSSKGLGSHPITTGIYVCIYLYLRIDVNLTHPPSIASQLPVTPPSIASSDTWIHIIWFHIASHGYIDSEQV